MYKYLSGQILLEHKLGSSSVPSPQSLSRSQTTEGGRQSLLKQTNSVSVQLWSEGTHISAPLPIYAYIHSHTDTHTDIHTYRHTYRHTHTYTYTHKHTHTHTHTHTNKLSVCTTVVCWDTHLCTVTYLHIHTYTYRHTYIQTYIQTHTYRHMNRHILTHKHT